MEPKATNAFVLPTSVVSPTDVARLLRELAAINNFFQSVRIRQAGEPTTLPRLSKLLDHIVEQNKLNLLQENDREVISSFLQNLQKRAPVMHISFSVDPPGSYVQKIVDWLRRNIDQYVLVTVGLQPNIGAGCVVRTTNKIFDFSLREYFDKKRDFFIEKLHNALSDDNFTQEQAPLAEEPMQTQPAPVQVAEVTPEVQQAAEIPAQTEVPVQVAPTQETEQTPQPGGTQ